MSDLAWKIDALAAKLERMERDAHPVIIEWLDVTVEAMHHQLNVLMGASAALKSQEEEE